MAIDPGVKVERVELHSANVDAVRRPMRHGIPRYSCCSGLPPSLALFIFFHNTPVTILKRPVLLARYIVAKRVTSALNCGKNS
jgi:predicted butyrate kinase (DUF1464 family)